MSFSTFRGTGRRATTAACCAALARRVGPVQLARRFADEPARGAERVKQGWKKTNKRKAGADSKKDVAEQAEGIRRASAELQKKLMRYAAPRVKPGSPEMPNRTPEQLAERKQVVLTHFRESRSLFNALLFDLKLKMAYALDAREHLPARFATRAAEDDDAQCPPRRWLPTFEVPGEFPPRDPDELENRVHAVHQKDKKKFVLRRDV